MRIVSLLPSATEILYAIGAGDEVVGVTHECDFPPEAARKPQLTSSALPALARAADIDRHVRANLHAGSSIYKLDADLLEQLAPDLIVTQELCPVCAVSYEIVTTAVRRLTGDPRVVSLEPSSLEDMYSTIVSLGELTRKETQAEREIASLRAREHALRERTAHQRRPTTLVLEWTDPPMSGGHWTPGLVEIAGGRPVLSHPGTDSQRLEWEAIAKADPDAIIVAPCGFDLARSEEATKELASLAAWRDLRAVRDGRVAIVDGNAFVNRPGPRLIDSAEIFAVAINPREVPPSGGQRDGWKWLVSG